MINFVVCVHCRRVKLTNFKLKVLSTREEAITSSTCYMCQGSLAEYIKAIPERYTDYDVQRGIVTNVYLDRLTQTILEKRYIPPIVLIANNLQYNESLNELSIQGEFKILDGLQRTYRIKSIFNALNLYIEELKKKVDFSEITKFKLSKLYKPQLEKLDSDATVLWSINHIAQQNGYDLTYLENVFHNFQQWFEVWYGLDKKEEINKMLVLNAGHKPMDIKHQLELLFLNVIPDEFLNDFVRAKDINSSFFYNKKEVGQLHLSHFISALLAFQATKPITVDAKYLQNLQNDLDQELEKIKYYFEEDNLSSLIEFTKKLDEMFANQYSRDNIGLEWLGRETVLIGLFAAFGKFYQKTKEQYTLIECLEKIKSKLQEQIHIFKIEEFNEAKTTSIDITKVNIGNVFKFTTFNATCQLLINENTQISWDILFKKGTKVDDECE